MEKSSIDTMFYDTVKIYDDYYYGMGWELTHNYSESMLFHGGLVENYTTYMEILPDSKIGIIFLLNTNDYLVLII